MTTYKLTIIIYKGKATILTYKGTAKALLKTMGYDIDFDVNVWVGIDDSYRRMEGILRKLDREASNSGIYPPLDTVAFVDKDKDYEVRLEQC